MSECIRGSYEDALYKSTYTLLLYFNVLMFKKAREIMKYRHYDTNDSILLLQLQSGSHNT